MKKDPRVALDFNAFAQGYSVDVVSDFLNSKKNLIMLKLVAKYLPKAKNQMEKIGLSALKNQLIIKNLKIH